MEKIFKYRDTTETFENILSEVFHSHEYRFEIIRDKNLFLNFYNKDKIIFHFDVNNNIITEYRYIKGDIVNYITERIYNTNLVLGTYPLQSTQKRAIYDNLQKGVSYTFDWYGVTRKFTTKSIMNIYTDKTRHIVICKEI